MKVKRSKYDIAVEVICVALLVGLGIYLMTQWSSLPDKIPAHYNGKGEIDRWGARGEILVVPITAAALYILLTVLEAFPKIWNTGITVTEENKEKLYRMLKNMMQTVKLLMVLTFFLMGIIQIQGDSLPWYYSLLEVGLILGVVVFYMVRIFRLDKK